MLMLRPCHRENSNTPRNNTVTPLIVKYINTMYIYKTTFYSFLFHHQLINLFYHHHLVFIITSTSICSCCQLNLIFLMTIDDDAFSFIHPSSCTPQMGGLKYLSPWTKRILDVSNLLRSLYVDQYWLCVCRFGSSILPSSIIIMTSIAIFFLDVG